MQFADQGLDAAAALGAAADAPVAFSPVRMVEANTAAILEQFRGSSLIGAGKLTLISLDAIERRAGSRWSLRRDVVHEHVERVFRKSMGEQALVQRISETEYLVAQSELSRLAGQLRCLNCLREVLQHFLGEANPGDLTIHEVTRIGPDGLYGQRIDAKAVEFASASERAAPVQAEPEPRRASLDRWSPFNTAGGLRVGVTCALEPVLSLKNAGRIGFRVASRVQTLPMLAALTRRQRERLSAVDLERIDFATIARALDRIRGAAAQRKPPTVIVPIACATLQSRRGRGVVIDLLRKGRSFVQHGIICELVGIEVAPISALGEIVSALSPFCLHVIGRLSDPSYGSLQHFVGVGFKGISVRAPVHASDSQFLAWSKQVKKSAGRVTRTLLLYQVGDLGKVQVARIAGATHATLAPQRLKAHLIDDEPW